MKYRGKWRFSEENNFYYGYLDYDKGTEITLEIFDDTILALSKHRPGQSGITILGNLEDGQLITLRNCKIVGTGPYLDEFQITRIEVEFVLLGGHDKRKEVELDSIVVGYSNLNSFISYNFLVNDPLSISDKNTNKYERHLDIPKICKIHIFPEYSSFQSNNRIYFKIMSIKNKQFRNYIKLKSILQDFLNFITSSEILVEKLFAEDVMHRYNVEYHSQRPVYTKRNKAVLFKPVCRSILFHYSTISSKIETILARWFRMAHRLKHVYDLYFGVVYHIDQYDIYRFLMLTTALEVYHGITMNGISANKKKKHAHYQKLSSKVSSITSFSRKELKELIQFLDRANELSFEERLKEVYDLFPDIVSKYCKFNDITNAVNLTTETRNYYTHYNPKKENKALKGTDLFMITRDLQFLLQLCLLLSLNFTKTEINNLYSVHPLPPQT